jgi:acyl-CoA reductase-like NAD-dependent aldehyde dehydrogenase
LVESAGALEARQNEFARLLTEEQGKPLSESYWEIGGAVGILRYYATLDLPPEVLKVDLA